MAKQQLTNQAVYCKQAMPQFLLKRLSEAGFIFILTCALFVLISLISYDLKDPSWSHVSRAQGKIANAGGQMGAYMADALYFAFGYLAYLLPIYFTYIAWLVLKDQYAVRKVSKYSILLRGSGLLFLIIGGCGLLSLEPQFKAIDGYHSAGGIFGNFIAQGFSFAASLLGASLLLSAIFLVGITLLTGLSWVNITEAVGFYTIFALGWLLRNIKTGWNFSYAKINSFKTQRRLLSNQKFSRQSVTRKEKLPSTHLVISPSVATIPQGDFITSGSTTPLTTARLSKPQVIAGLPSLDLLEKPKANKAPGGYTPQELESLSREVEQHLLDFGIQADVVAVHPGPVITRFELQLAAGIKVSKLSTLAKDLARSLSVISVRVVEVIPGKTVVGLELPNQYREVVSLSEVLSAEVYQQAHAPLALALGVDIAGHPMVVDLAKMPHLLVAGTTGSGKSVGINAMILSILFKSTPEQVRLIMIDPKMLELSVYDGIPHLLTPVVTDMKEAASALRWCVGEMERRYRLMASLGVRNLAGFNVKVNEAKAKGEPLVDPLWKPADSLEDQAPALHSLPYIVVVIDELADMMMVVGKKVEQLIARIAQKARAAGIHLILATQRPSVDVLTGLIKSNIPTRLSFQVSSKIDSRTILDQQGAEQLLGQGDMLYLAPGTGAPLRVHGAFIDDREVHRIAADWRARGEPDYINEITQWVNEGGESGFNEEGQPTEEADPLYDQAVEFVMQTRKASISAVQRRLKIGYNRAARLIEEMERTGVVGPLEGGFREVLVSVVSEE